MSFSKITAGFFGILMFLALAAYASYVVNAAQFLLKLRAARLESRVVGGSAAPALGYAE